MSLIDSSSSSRKYSVKMATTLCRKAKTRTAFVEEEGVEGGTRATKYRDGSLSHRKEPPSIAASPSTVEPDGGMARTGADEEAPSSSRSLSSSVNFSMTE